MPFEEMASYDETSKMTSDNSDQEQTFTTSSKLEKEWKNKIHQKLLKVMDLTLIDNLEPTEARHQIREICQQLIHQEAIPCNQASRHLLIKQIEDEIMGLGPLEPLLADPTISDILVNGPESVFVERAGKLQATDIRFNNENHLLNIIDRIVSSVGRRIDESSPMVDARLKDGSRVNAIIPPLALDGPSVSIRRFAIDRLTMDNLVELGSVPKELAQVFEGIVKARLNILISGGTGSGKTTMLNILSGFIPKDERIVTIEDSAELQLQQPHTVRLETRPPNIEGKGQVSQRDLVRNSLRMRPDRIVIGEVRGGEALDMLQAMNTGHDGSLTTVHANSARDALGRIENMVSMSGINFPTKTLRAQIASAINIVIQIERMEDGHRRMTSLQEINGMEGDVVTMTELFRFERQGIDENGKVLGRYRATGIIPAFFDHLKQRGIELHYHLFDL